VIGVAGDEGVVGAVCSGLGLVGAGVAAAVSAFGTAVDGRPSVEPAEVDPRDAGLPALIPPVSGRRLSSRPAMSVPFSIPGPPEVPWRASDASDSSVVVEGCSSSAFCDMSVFSFSG
jgi:hypothetical protein